MTFAAESLISMECHLPRLSTRLLWISKLFLKNIIFFIKKIIIIFLNTPLPTYSLLIEVGFQNIVVEISQFLVFV
jgi:hypothetical protein